MFISFCGSMRLLSMVLLVGVFLISDVRAQALGRFEATETNISTYYHFVQPGTATIQVHVLGTVHAPGLYELSAGTDLDQLLALTGGPMLVARERANRRDTAIRLYRQMGAGRQLVYETGLNDALTGVRDQVSLQDGDILVIEVIEQRRLSWRDVAIIVGGVASLALAIERLSGL